MTRSLATIWVLVLCFLGTTGPSGAQARDESARNPELVIQKGHRRSAVAVSMGPRDDVVATVGEDGEAKLWDISSGRLLATLVCPIEADESTTAASTSVSFSPDGRILVTGCDDGRARLWDTATARLTKVIHGVGERGDPIQGVAWQPGGRLVAAWTRSGFGSLVDTGTGAVRKLAPIIPSKGGSLATLRRLAFSGDGTVLVGAGGVYGHEGLFVWKTATVEAPAWMEIPHSTLIGIGDVAVSPDGRQALVACNNSDLVLVDLVGRREVARRTSGIYPARVGWNRLGLLLAGPTGNVLGCPVQGDGQVVLLDASTLALRHVLRPSTEEAIPMALSAGGGEVAAVALTDGSAVVWNLRSREVTALLKGKVMATTALAVSADGTLLVTGGWGCVTLWDLRLGRVLRTLKGIEGYTWAVGVTPSGDRIVAVDGNCGRALAWSRADGALLWTYPAGNRPMLAPGKGFVHLAVTPDGKSVAVAGGDGDGRLVLLDIATGRLVRELNKPDWRASAARGMAFRPGTTTLAVTRGDGSVVECDTHGMGQVRVRMKPSRAKEAGELAYSPDGRWLAVATGYSVLLWECQSEGEGVELSGLSQRVAGVAFSQDGKSLAVGHHHTGIEIFDVATRKPARSIVAPTFGFSNVLYSADGRVLVSTGLDSTIRLWDPSTSRLLLTALVLDDSSNWVATTPDGLFDGSPEGQRAIFWRVGDRLFSLEQFFNRFYHPGILSEIMGPRRKGATNATLPRATAVMATLKPPPQVTIDLPRSGDSIATGLARVEVSVGDQGGGASKVALYVNGHRVTDSRRTMIGTKAVFEARLTAGRNTLRATAFNQDGSMESRGDHIRVECTAREGARPVLHVVAVGIDRYKAGLRLQFARTDAEAVAGFFKPGLFSDVQVHLLVNEQADKAAFLKAVGQVRDRCGAQDVLLLYLAGHGTLQGDLYYFLPYDARVDTPEALSQTAVSSVELADLLSGVEAAKQLVILDSCHSGAAGSVLGRYLASRGDAIGLIRAQQVLARASGTFLVAAASASQSAKEYQSLGHGVLTFALLEGLGARGAPAAAIDGDGRVTVNSLIQYLSTEVPRLDQKHGGGGQDVVQYSTGHDFPLVLGRPRTEHRAP